MPDCLFYCICYQTREINSVHIIEYEKRSEYAIIFATIMANVIH